MATNYWPHLSLSFNPSSSSSSSLLSSCGSTSSPSNSPPPTQDSGKTGKRSSTRHRETWSRDTISLEDDGFQWRKYGEKVILGQPYPRSYFRCSYRYDQGCLATKQVQRIREDPPIYRTTYIHHHTCRRPHTLHQIIRTHDSLIDSATSFGLVTPPIPTQSYIGNVNANSRKNKQQEWKEDPEMGKDLRLSISSDTEACSSSSSSTSQTSCPPVPAIDFDAGFCLRL